jgi:hypothetical protein
MLKRFLWVIGVVLVANAGAFAVVVRNSNGAPDASVQLTERELRLSDVDVENTGMTLRLRWHQPAAPVWFDRAKLTLLGFDCSVDPKSQGAREHYNSPAFLPRTAYVVLEYTPDQPPPDDAAVPKKPTREPRTTPGVEATHEQVLQRISRLKPVDAGNNAAVLRRAYPDRRRFIITRGLVRLFLTSEKEPGGPALVGSVVQLLPDELWVPRTWQPMLLKLWASAHGYSYELSYDPRYEATVEYGRDALPRIVGVKEIRK